MINAKYIRRENTIMNVSLILLFSAMAATSAFSPITTSFVTSRVLNANKGALHTATVLKDPITLTGEDLSGIVVPAPPPTDQLKVFIIGGPTGLIGKTLLNMMTNERKTPGIECIGACNTSYCVKFLPEGSTERTDWFDGMKLTDEFIASCAAAPGANICIADCSASEEIANRYASLQFSLPGNSS